MDNIKPINLDLSHFNTGYEVNPKDITREKPKNLEHQASGLNRPEGNIMSPKRKYRLPKPPSGQRKKPKRRSSARAKEQLKNSLYKRTANPSAFLDNRGTLGGKRKTRKKRRKRKKSLKSKKRRRKRKTRKKRGRGKVSKQTQKKKQKPGILKSKIRNPFKKPRRVTFRPPGRSKLRIEHNPKAMMESAIHETQQAQGAEKDAPLSTFTEDLNRALPYTPPPMPKFKDGDSGSDDELKDIAAKSSQ